RSTKTLHVRMERHCFNAKKIAEYLERHPMVEKVIYPGLTSHPQHHIAKNQMKNFGGMISIVLKEGLPFARKFLEKVHLFSSDENGVGYTQSSLIHSEIAATPTDEPIPTGPFVTLYSYIQNYRLTESSYKYRKWEYERVIVENRGVGVTFTLFESLLESQLF